MEPSRDTLLAYVLGELIPAERQNVRAAIEADARVEAEYRAILRTALAARVAQQAAPADTIRRAQTIGGKAPAIVLPWKRWLDQLEQIVAALIHDTRAPGALAGLRSAAIATQLTLAAGGVEVDLQLDPGRIRGAYSILGAVSAPVDALPAPIALLDPAGNVVVETITDEFGEFSLSFEGASFVLMLRVDERIVISPRVELHD